MSNEIGEIRGHVVVVMAPMGSGKGTLIQNGLKKHPAMRQTISCTSRAMRPREVNGKHYHFVTRDEFDKKIETGDFLEWAEFAGNKYGTLKSEILPRLKECEVVIVEIELQGVEQLLDILPREHMTIIYIESGGWDVLRKRAESRSPMSEESLKARYDRYLIEKQAKPLADVIIDNTAGIQAAFDQFNKSIEVAHTKCKI